MEQENLELTTGHRNPREGRMCWALCLGRRALLVSQVLQEPCVLCCGPCGWLAGVRPSLSPSSFHSLWVV